MDSYELALTNFKKSETALQRAQGAYEKATKPDDITRARKAIEAAEVQASMAYEHLESLRQRYWVERYKAAKEELFEKAAPLISEAVQCCKNANIPGLVGNANRLEVVRELIHQPPLEVDMACDIPGAPISSDVLGRI